jgi:hypothetical protein
MEAAKAAVGASPAPPTKWWRRLINRIKGIPGASFGVGLLQLLWNYAPFIFRRGEDTDFLWGLWIRAGGDFPMLVQAITSPFFGIALIAGGIGYAIFAKEPERPVSPIVPKIGWAVVAVCALVLSTMFLFEEFLKASRIGQYVHDLTDERHLTEHQREKIKENLEPISKQFKRQIAVYAVDNPEVSGYAVEIMKALKASGLPIMNADDPNFTIPLQARTVGTELKGVKILVSDPKNPPDEAKLIAHALNDADIVTGFHNSRDYWIDNYAIVVTYK